MTTSTKQPKVKQQPAVIKVNGLAKEFLVPHEKVDSLKGRATQLFRRVPTKGFTALSDISFDVKKGQFFGIVGRNGSGKSTLLKILAGIYQPSQGQVEIDGSMATFIELGVGFNVELSGRDNVFLNGAILGMSRKEIQKKFDEIIAYSELEEFIDQKIKNYSSGMQVRLAFAIASQAEADILLVDEVLAVGDVNFQAKCYDLFRDMKKKGKTILFVGHDMSVIRDFCDQAILIHDSKVVASGDPEKVINAYNYYNLEDTQRRREDARHEGNEKRWGTGDVTIESFYAVSGDERRSVFKADESVEVIYDILAHNDVESPVVGMVMKNAQGLPIFVTNTKIKNIKLPNLKKGEKITVRCRFDNVFANGSYLISPAVASRDARVFYDWIEEALTLQFLGRIVPDGLVQPNHSFDIEQGGKS